MAKKKRGDAHGGGHGWFVTFADLMGLMMSFFVMLVALGVILSVGAYPYQHPTAFGGLAKLFMTKTTVGLALVHAFLDGVTR